MVKRIEWIETLNSGYYVDEIMETIELKQA